MTFPTEREALSYYGDPRNGDVANQEWERANLVRIVPPFQMTYDGKPISSIRVHKRCSASLSRVLCKIWDAAGRKQSVVDAWGVSKFAGTYVYRLKRGGSSISMHALGIAIDLDPARNAFHDTTPNFANVPQVVEAFESEGWEWGGRWKGRACDGMHFQATKPRYAVPPPKAAKVVAKPKEQITVKDLRAAGSETVAGGDKAQTGAVGTGISATIGAVALDRLQGKVVDKVEAAIDTAPEAIVGSQKFQTWFDANWPALLLVAAGLALLYFVWRAWEGGAIAKQARVTAARTGMHVGRIAQ